MRFVLAGLVVALGAGCGLTTQVRPVPRGVVQVEGAAGGALVRIGPTLPVPLSTVGVRYGVAERFDVAAHAHLTSLTFGVAGLDVGGGWLALQQDGAVPAVSLAGRVYGFTSVLGRPDTSPRAYVEVSPTVSYLLGGRFLSYASASGLVQLAGGRPLLALAVGEQVQLERWGVQLEMRWYQPDMPTRFNAVDWVGLSSQGALGAVLGVSYRFGGETP